MRKGFACLFTGEPGTGKTETAYQIARQTGRDIMLVDIAGSKSMWFGESEKQITKHRTTSAEVHDSQELKNLYSKAIVRRC
jgi:DNA helicase TIP49 (TBP-interacting protein)